MKKDIEELKRLAGTDKPLPNYDVLKKFFEEMYTNTKREVIKELSQQQLMDTVVDAINES